MGSQAGWLLDHPRLISTVAFLWFGVAFAYLDHPLAILCFAIAGVFVYLTAMKPESVLAIQEDGRAQERRTLCERFAGCLEQGGLSAMPGEVKCLEIDPPVFLYETDRYGMTKDKVEKMCSEALPAFGAVRYTVEWTTPQNRRQNQLRIAFHWTTETEALETVSVTYEDIEREEPTYKRIPVGLFEDGTVAFVSLDNRNALVGGLPRSGKSVFLSTLLLGLSRCDHERVLVLSPKILDFQAFEPRAELYQKPGEMLDALRRVNQEIESRKRYCERTHRKKVDKFSWKRPHISIIVDEYAVIRGSRSQEEDGKKPRKIGEEIERELFEIVSQGAFSGCQVVITSQRLSSTVIATDLRDICAGNLISFANGSETTDAMIFGDYASDAPASKIPVSAKGVGYIFAEGDMQRPRLFKCAMAGISTERRIVNENKERKPREQ